MKPTTHTPRVSIAIIVPVCNEEESVPVLRRRLQALQSTLGRHYRMHYIFVDDGSTDGTVQLLPGAVPKGVTYEICEHGTNKGVGAAFRTGFRQVTADIVCTIDADCSYGPENLVKMIQQVESNATDIVVASPYHPLGAVMGVQAWRLLLSSQCSRLYRIVSPLKLYTYTSIFRVYRGSAVRDVEFSSDSFVSVVEILLSASRLGYRISEAPLTLHRRVAGVSKMKVANTIREHLLLMAGCVRTRSVARRKAPPVSVSPAVALELLPFAAVGKSRKNREGVPQL
jgi:dolichol-phosphate mannosyltransferase